MELLKFIAEEFLHIEPKAYLFALSLVFQECCSAPEMEGSGMPPRLACRIETSIPSPALPQETLSPPHEGGKDLTVGVGNIPAFFMGKQSMVPASPDRMLTKTYHPRHQPWPSSTVGPSKGCTRCDFSGGASSPWVMSSGGRKCGDFQGRALSGVFFLCGIDTFFILRSGWHWRLLCKSTSEQDRTCLKNTKGIKLKELGQAALRHENSSVLGLVYCVMISKQFTFLLWASVSLCVKWGWLDKIILPTSKVLGSVPPYRSCPKPSLYPSLQTWLNIFYTQRPLITMLVSVCSDILRGGLLV